MVILERSKFRNATGTDPIPFILQTASGRRGHISVFGNEYGTPDGTCVGDYIHISDLCDAHLGAQNDLQREGQSRQFNLGNGSGFSALETINIAKSVTGIDFEVRFEAAHEGDPAVLVADATLARAVLEWEPKFADLETIVDYAWQCELKNWPG